MIFYLRIMHLLLIINWYQNAWFVKIVHIKLCNHQGCRPSVSHSLKKGQGAGQKKGTFDARNSPKRALLLKQTFQM